jgi:DEAD/DEAH box helicase domain-containing protein
VNLPEKDMHTTSYWFTIPRDLLRKLSFTPAEIIDGLSGLAYTLHHLSAMYLMADTHDIDRSLGDKSGEWFVSHGKTGRIITSFGSGRPENLDDKTGVRIDEFDPTIFIFDSYPGGIGFSELLYREHANLLSAAKSLVEKCPCAYGCPSCVGPTLEVGKTAKEIVPKIVELIIGK